MRFIDGGQLLDLGQLLDGGRRNPITGGGGITDKPQGCFPINRYPSSGAIEPEGGCPLICTT